jgi:transcriptional regulator with XRE-family HTH domain
MKMGSAFRDLVQQARQSAAYWATGIALDFAESVDRLMRNKGMSRTDLAKKLGTSLPYVTKVLRGEANFTLETMAKIAMAIDATVEVRLVDNETSSLFFVPARAPAAKFSGMASAYTPLSVKAANECTRDSLSAATAAA